MSNNLSSGINFGTINSLPAIQLNATDNYIGNITGYSIDVSNDSNVNADFCIKADNLNTSAGDEIGLGNYTWEDDTVNNLTQPATFGTSFTQSYVVGTTNVAPAASNYYRLWLNISASQAPGTYNNTVSFQGVPNGDPCT